MGYPLIDSSIYQADWKRWADENNRQIETYLIRIDERAVRLDTAGTIPPKLLPSPLPELVETKADGGFTPGGGAGDTFRVPYFVSTGDIAGASMSTFGLSLLNDVDAAAARTTLGAQALDATLTALSGANWAANAIPIGSGADTVAQVSFAANTFPGRSSSGNLVAKTMTDFGFSLVDDANAAAAQSTLGLVIGTNVQAFDATLQALAGTNWAANSVAVGTGVNTATQVTLTTNTLLANDSGGTVFASPVSDVSLANLLPQASFSAWRSALGATTVGGNLFTLANPSAIRFIRINADNSVTLQTAANFVTDIGLEANANYVHIAGTETITGAKTFQMATGFINITSSTGTNHAYTQFSNTGGTYFVGIDNSAGSAFSTGVAYAGVWQVPATRSAIVSVSGTGNIATFSATGAAVTGLVSYTAALFETGVISPAQITANTDNYAPTGFATTRWIRVSTDVSRNITGLAGGAAGRRVGIINIGAQNLVFQHDVTSTAANRFLCPGSAAFTLNANDAVELWYDTTSSRWRLIAF